MSHDKDMSGTVAWGWWLSVVLMATAVPLNAALVTQSADLDPGDSYRLAFVTSTNTDATSADINHYNNVVQLAADAVPELLALGIDWRALGSTPTVDARDNTDTNPTTSTGVPIYLLSGALLVTNNADLWDGSIRTKWSVTETGAARYANVWTGSGYQGIGGASGSGTLGSSGLIVRGINNTTNSGWIVNSTAAKTTQQPLYAVSEVLTVPYDIPAPAALPAGLALLGMIAMRRRRA